jgi:hypothetical protein
LANLPPISMTPAENFATGSTVILHQVSTTLVANNCNNMRLITP